MSVRAMRVLAFTLAVAGLLMALAIGFHYTPSTDCSFDDVSGQERCPAMNHYRWAWWGGLLAIVTVLVVLRLLVLAQRKERAGR